MNTPTTFQKKSAKKSHKKFVKNMKKEIDSEEVESLQLRPNRLEVQARSHNDIQGQHLVQVSWLDTDVSGRS